MECPVCLGIQLKELLTTSGVLVDWCPQCEGIWLDKGEIYFFTKAPTYLRWKIDEALKNQKPSERLNPHTRTPLVELSLLEGALVIDYCVKTGGIWLDKGELERVPAAKKFKLKLALDKNVSGARTDTRRVQIRLPNLAFTSSATLFFLYGLLSLVLITLVSFGFIEPGIALVLGIIFAALQFFLSPFIMDLTLRWMYRARSVEAHELPKHLDQFIRKAAKEHGINYPRMKIIPDGSPNAFTYGHTPNNARIVITIGLIDLLEPEELEAVVAHEIGHAVHWDMLVMTVAYLVPLVLYYIFRTLIRMRSSGNDRSAPARIAIAIVAYILYVISEYIVLWFSRVREYFADRFAGVQTQNPNSLAAALVKIGYGLAGKEKKKEQRKGELESIKAMGVFDPGSARALAITSYHPRSMGGDVDKADLAGAMRWDLWNPWALYYELHSTHPLIAKRLLALSRQSESLGMEPYIRFDERKPESYWDEFFFDLFIGSLPFFALIISAVLFFAHGRDPFFIKAGLVFLGAAYLMRVMFSYNFSYFPDMNIASLLKKVKVSSVRPVPCTLKGKIIGRGVPGLIWSEDFVLQDETGIIFLDYRQPLGIWNFLFGVLRAGRYIGETVEIQGWYRRAPIPYMEIKTLRTTSGKSDCYVFNVKLIASWVLMGAGILSFFLL